MAEEFISTGADQISAIYKSKLDSDSIFVFADSSDLDNFPGLDYGEMHEATCRWFVDKLGFTTKSFTCSDGQHGFTARGPVVLVTFVDDGIVMAKIQGLI